MPGVDFSQFDQVREENEEAVKGVAAETDLKWD